MDPRNLECYEFLDLSDVEEHERRELKKTLFSESTPDFLQLPWTDNKSVSDEWQKVSYEDECGHVPNGPMPLGGDGVCGSVQEQSGPVAQHLPAVTMYSQPAPPPPQPYSVPPPPSPAYQHPQNVFANVSMHGYVTGHYVPPPPHYTVHEPPSAPAPAGHRGRARGRGAKRADSLVEGAGSPGFNPQFMPIHYHHPAYYPANVGTPMQHPTAHNATGSPLYIAPVYTHMYGAYHQPQYYPAPPHAHQAHVNSIMEDPVPDMAELALDQQSVYHQHADAEDVYSASDNVMETVIVNSDQISCHAKLTTEPYLNNNHIELSDVRDTKPDVKPLVENIQAEAAVKVSVKSVNKPVVLLKNDTEPVSSAPKQDLSNNTVTLPKVAACPVQQTVAEPSTIPVNNIQTTEIKTNVDNVTKPNASPPVQDVSVVSVNTKPELEEPAPTPPSKSWASLFQNNQSQFNNADNAKLRVKSPVSATLGARTPEEKLPNRNVMDAKTVHPNPPVYNNDPNSHRMGEFLTKYTLDNRIVSVQPRGLTNRSNYCYINSILQALLACPPFYNLLKAMPVQPRKSSSMKSAMPIIDSMIEFVNEFTPLAADARLNRKEKGPRKDNIDVICGIAFEPSRIYKILNGIRSDTFIVEGRQEDAEEFFGCLVNGLNDEMLELMKLVDPGQQHEILSNGDIANNKDSEGQDEVEWKVMGPKNKGSITRRADFGRTPISDIFRGQLRSRVHRTGDQVTDNVQPFFTLQLDIEKASSVSEALELLVNKDKLEGVTCSRTNQQVEAWQQVMIEELPLVMVLHLKCFHYKLDACSKIIKALDFPVDLKIDSKLLSSKAKYTGKQKQYKLFAVVCHDGKEASKGHYLTDAYHAGYGGWVRYDDATVKSVQENFVLHPNATRVPYLLFYRRCDTIGTPQQPHQPNTAKRD